MTRLLMIKIYQDLLPKNGGYDQSEKNYNVNKEIRIKTLMLRSDLCVFSDAYVVVKGAIALQNQIMQKEKKCCIYRLYFKN